VGSGTAVALAMFDIGMKKSTNGSEVEGGMLRKSKLPLFPPLHFENEAAQHVPGDGSQAGHNNAL
jgi:hypothetical protein